MLTLLLFFVIVSASASDNCTCVPYYQCSEETGSLILDGKGLLDLRHFNKTECTGYFDVCCNVTNIAAIKTKKPKFHGCGYQNYGFSWLAAVLLKSATIDFHEYKCGASVIHRQAVITAAHCVRARDGVWQVRVGDHYFAIKKLIVHPNFNSGSLQNDISLIILENPIDIPMEYICVPPPGVEIQNERCTVIVPREKHPINMKIIELPIVSSDECQTKLRNTRLGSFFHLHDSFMCAGGETFEDVCGGDGGSPLICPVRLNPEGTIRSELCPGESDADKIMPPACTSSWRSLGIGLIVNLSQMDLILTPIVIDVLFTIFLLYLNLALY